MFVFFFDVPQKNQGRALHGVHGVVSPRFGVVGYDLVLRRLGGTSDVVGTECLWLPIFWGLVVEPNILKRCFVWKFHAYFRISRLKYVDVVFTQVAPSRRSVSLAEPKLLCRVPSGFCRMKTGPKVSTV